MAVKLVCVEVGGGCCGRKERERERAGMTTGLMARRPLSKFRFSLINNHLGNVFIAYILHIEVYFMFCIGSSTIESN